MESGIEILSEALRRRGYDGLADPDGDCRGCELHDLYWCGRVTDCVPGRVDRDELHRTGERVLLPASAGALC